MSKPQRGRALVALGVGWLIAFAIIAFGARVIWFGITPGTGVADVTGAGFSSLALILGGIAVGIAANGVAAVLNSDSAA